MAFDGLLAEQKAPFQKCWKFLITFFRKKREGEKVEREIMFKGELSRRGRLKVVPDS